jgi:DNA polymerase III alpha subunit
MNDNNIITGTIKTLKVLHDKNGKEIAFATIFDEKGEEIDLIFFSSVWKECCPYVKEGKELTVKGKIEQKENGLSCRVENIVFITVIFDIQKPLPVIEGMSMEEYENLPTINEVLGSLVEEEKQRLKNEQNRIK